MAFTRNKGEGAVVGVAQIIDATVETGAYGAGEKTLGVLAGMAVGALVTGTLGVGVVGIAAAAGLGYLAGKLGEMLYRQELFPVVNDFFDSLGNIGKWMGGVTYDWLHSDAFAYIAGTFNLSQSFIPPRDPLVLDLDGDGLETVGPAQSGVKFDHNADGVKTGTGWVGPDDGFLVMDRNGNGVIDNGRELFGDATLLYTGGTAADGFAALAQEDSNGDGKITSADSKWSSLRIWRDLNQDGISQANKKNGVRSCNQTNA